MRAVLAERTCVICDTTFTPTNDDPACSPACWGKLIRRHMRELTRRANGRPAKRKRPATKKCKTCGTRFVARTNARYCSDSCRAVARRSPRGPGRPYAYSDEQIINALRIHAFLRGRTPSLTTWAREKRRPSAGTISRRFGTWVGALRAAGFEPSRYTSCAVCSAPLEPHSTRKLCSPECRREHKRRYFREYMRQRRRGAVAAERDEHTFASHALAPTAAIEADRCRTDSGSHRKDSSE